jgi:hypothetical protein
MSSDFETTNSSTFKNYKLTDTSQLSIINGKLDSLLENRLIMKHFSTEV